MAPDRGQDEASAPVPGASHELSHPSSIFTEDLGGDDGRGHLRRRQSDMGCYGKPYAAGSPLEGTNFTLRGVLVGTVIGILIAASNTYFGLQTGWISGMAMPASLLGFGFFKMVSKHLKLPFTPVENVLVQTVAGAVGTMPLGLGFVGVMPSLEFLLKKSEGAPIDLGLGRLIVWGIGLCLFGVVFGVPLRTQVIIRERLKFPSGTATALMISVLHGGVGEKDKDRDVHETQGPQEREGLLPHGSAGDEPGDEAPAEGARNLRADWKRQIKLLFKAFAGSGIYTVLQYFFPVLHKLPIFGSTMANKWEWTLNPSPAYVGQGIIMGPVTTFHMLLGAIVGWSVLSPLAKYRNWAPGDVDDWENGSKGWIVWVSLAIMLADAVVNLGWFILRPILRHAPNWYSTARERYRLAVMLPLTLILCVVCVHLSFGEYIPIPLNILALVLALFLSIMGVRALGETDLNPVSGISKLTQLIFAVVTPPNSRNAVIINLLAGAVSEAGALQAGDICQDLKAGHLIGASPKAQFYGQLIGSIVGAFVSAAIYKLYTKVYTLPNESFQIPTAHVWISTARLVTGKGLPLMAGPFALAAGGIFSLTTALRLYLLASGKEWQRKLCAFIPGGIAVAVGMYNTPSFTLARTIGGIISWYWTGWKGRDQTRVIVLASGLILGEGIMSIVNLVLASLNVRPLQ
ncbi:hypothetical protein DV736_g666, partial [Chaetothyriales sp. CBS 134916]